MEVVVSIACLVMAYVARRMNRLRASDCLNVTAEQFDAWRKVHLQAYRWLMINGIAGLFLWAAALYLGYNFARRIPESTMLLIGVPISVAWVVSVIASFVRYSKARNLASSLGIRPLA